MLIAIVLLPFLFGLSCAFWKEGRSKSKVILMLIMQATELSLVIYAVMHRLTLNAPVWYMTESLTFSLKMDPVGAFYCVLTAACWLLTILYASVYMTHEGGEPRFYTFLFTTEAMVLGSALAGDMITFYIFFELTSLLSAPLVLHDLTANAIRGAVKYLYYSIAGAFMALFGIVMLSTVTSSLSFAPGGTLTATELSPIMMVAIFLAILGFGAKAGLFPMHNWLPAAHPVAPAPAHALLSGIIAKVGALGILRVMFYIVGGDMIYGTWVQYACLIMALVTVFMGSTMGYFEMGLKKRLAYSSISQISYVLVGLFLMCPDGIAGGLLQVFFHATAKICIFQCAGAIIFLTGATRVDDFSGMGRRIPLVMVCFTLVSLSLIGIPPFGGFWSKWYMALGALRTMSGPLAYIVPAILLISALLTAGYLFQPIVSAFFPGEDVPKDSCQRIYEPPAMMVSLVIFSIICIVLGFMPNAVISAMQSIAGSML